MVRSPCRWQQKAAGLCLLALGAVVEWDVSEMQLSPCLCRIVSARERNESFKHTPSFWDSVPFLEISPLLLKCEFCLETRRWKFLGGLFIYIYIKCESSACIYTSKSLALSCLEKVNKG